MTKSKKHQIEGAVHKVTGTAKEIVGQLLSSPFLTAEGQSERLVGNVQKKISQIERVFEK